MHLVYPTDVDLLPYAKLGEAIEGKNKNVWVFPIIGESFEAVVLSNGKIVIDPSMYYITSGEAVRKTEVLIDDIKDCMEKYVEDQEIIDKLGDLLVDVGEFLDLLIEVKDSSDYLEVTKCEDGVYSSNICARKDRKKKKPKT